MRMEDAQHGNVEHIFYASRTHSQLSQVIKELKQNNYLMNRHGNLNTTEPRKLRMTILASKQMYCINQKVRDHPTLSVDDICGRYVDIEDLIPEKASETTNENQRNTVDVSMFFLL